MGVAAEMEEIRCGSRSATRVRVRALVESRLDGVELPLFVHDLSVTGMMVETRNATLSAGDWVKVRLPLLLDRMAEVMWTRAGVAGVSFAEPLSQETLAIVVRAMTPPEDRG